MTLSFNQIYTIDYAINNKFMSRFINDFYEP